MATFSNCLRIVNAMPQRDQDALLARLDQLIERGVKPEEAQLQAAVFVLAQVKQEAGIRKSASREALERANDDFDAVLDEAGGGWTQKGPYPGAKKTADGFWLSRDGEFTAVPVGGYGWRVVPLDTARFVLQHGFGNAHPNRWAIKAFELARDGKDPAQVRGDAIRDFLDFEDAVPDENEPRWIEPVVDSMIEAARAAFGDIRKSAARVIDTPEFKQFFGKSKVKGKDGKPQVMYHATTRGGFDVFDRMKTTEWRRESMDTVGSWFSDSAGEDGAGRYVPGEGATIYPVYLRIEKPKVYKTFTSFLDDMHKAAGRDPKTQNPRGVGSTTELRQKLKAQGYDGIHFLRTDNKGLLDEMRELDDLIRTYERKDPEYADELRDERKKVRAQYEKTGGSTEFDDQDVWVAFEPNQIKSAIGNNGDFDINNPSIIKSESREISPLGFYSALADGIAKVQSKEMAAPGWKQAVKALINKGQAKQDEIDWSGINEWLDLQRGKISKDAVLEYLRGNGVQVEETVLGGPQMDYEQWLEANPQAMDLDEDARDAAYEAAAAKDGGATKFSTYGPPGGENYREVLLTLPAIGSGTAMRESLEAKYPGKIGRELYLSLTPQEKAAWDREMEANKFPGYRSSHWDQSNVLAHLRVDDRTDADGKRVLFIREIQSDWGQQGKKEGFADPNNRPVSRKEFDAYADKLVDDYADQQAQAGEDRREAERRAINMPLPELARILGRADEYARMRAGRDLDMEGGGDRPPAAPFVGKTDAWVGLALKRAIIMAAQEGYDKVALINGEQAADMFDLSKQIQSLSYTPKPNDLGILEAWDANRVNVIRKVVPTNEVEDYIGKEIAQRLLATTPVMGKHLLDGEDIKVGGEGMKAFYDSIVPKVAKDVVKKLGGQVGTVSIEMGERLGDEQFGADDTRVEEARGEFGERGFRTTDGQFFEAYADAVDHEQSIAAKDVKTTEQIGFSITPEMREKVDAGVPLFSRDRTSTPEFKRWFGDSKVVDSNGEPRVMYHGTAATNVSAFKGFRGVAGHFAFETELANDYADSGYADAQETGKDDEYGDGAVVYPVYLSAQNLFDARNPEHRKAIGMKYRDGDSFGYGELERSVPAMKRAGFDGYYDIEYVSSLTPADEVYAQGIAVFDPEQVKSATGNNGEFDPENPDIRKSANRPWFDDLQSLKVSTNYQLGDLLKTSKKLSWWDRTVGTQYNLAQKHPEFKRVFDAVQRFINDVSAFATRAADMAPSILPKLETLKDIAKAPLSAADVKALRDPVFGGTLNYTRDESGDIVQTDDVQEAGVVFTDAELRSMFNLNDRQIGLYREFRRATDQSLADLAISDMLRYVGEDARDIREQVIGAGNVDVAAGIIESHLRDLGAATPERQAMLEATIEAIQDKANQANRLMDRGYAPLSRFGQYTVYVQGADGEQVYFSMFENERDANKMAREMRDQYPDARVSTGVMSEESYKLFSGVTPETLALFGDALGLEESGIDTKSEAFQQMLKVAKTNRSAMKRLIQRKGIDGFSEDAGRVLAGFVYSNARQIATNLHAGEIGKAASSVKDGDVKDAAIRLMQYIQNPQEEAQAIRGLLFTQFIGGSIASALVNMTQPFTMTLPYLSQFAGATGASKLMADAVKLTSRGIRNDAELQQALKRAEDEGVVSPQEVHQLMAQARGKGSLQSGDGTRAGDAMAKANNFMAKVGLGWGKLFSAAEQFNRRVTFIAAYKMARDQGMENPFAFAEKAIAETQGVYNKGNKPVWARGAVGGTLFTFKQYSIAYVEFLRRMWGNGPEGKKAVGLALAVLFLSAGLGGMPGADDLDDVVDGFAQRVLGKSFDSKQAKKEFFASILGQSGAEFVMSGLTGLPGAPIDVSGRLGLGNLIPGTGLFTKKKDYGRDVSEVFGPAGSFFANIAAAAGNLAQGDIRKAAEVASPVAIANAVKGFDMYTMGMYRDTRGRKVIDVDTWESVVKAIGFQPASVKRVQDATGTQQGLIAQNKLREAEIADKWAAGRIERNPDKVREAQEELADWNRKNPESPIKIDAAQINKRVIEANKSKAQRIAATAPQEIRATVKRELAPAE